MTPVQMEVVPAGDETSDIIVQPVKPPAPVEPANIKHFGNLTPLFTDEELTTLGNYITQRVSSDIESKAEWEQQVARAIELLGLSQQSKPDNSEYEDSDTSDHSLLLQSLTRFQASALSEMLPPDKICNAEALVDLESVPPDQRTQVEEQINKVQETVVEFVSDYCLNRLGTYANDHDRTLYDTGLAGTGFKKIFMDTSFRDVARVEQVPAEDLIVSYDSVSLQTGRVTHKITMQAVDLIKNIEGGVYRSIQIEQSTEDDNKVTQKRDDVDGVKPPDLTARDTYELYETHLDIVLEPDVHARRLPRPYVITVDRESSRVLGIRRNWKKEDEYERRIEAFVNYMFHPGKSGIYGLGLGQILSNVTQALRTAQRRALEAAYLANHPIGMKSSNFTIRDGSSRMVPGSWKDVDAPTGKVSDAFSLFPFKGPDQGLMTLFEVMQNNGKELGGTQVLNMEQLLKQNAPAASTLALLEENNKFMTAVHRRLYSAHKKELKLLHTILVAAYGNRDIEFGNGKVLKKGDLESVILLPAMHPLYANRQRQIVEGQAVLQTAKEHPKVVNERAAVEYYFMAIGVDNPDGLLIPPPQEAKPTDAISEYAKVMRNEPLKAGVSQDHASHIDSHLAQIMMIQASKLPVEVGQQAIMAITGHMAEHMSLQLAVMMSTMLGLPMQMLMEGIPPQIENEIAPLIAQAMQAIAEHVSGQSEEDIRVTIENIKAQNKMQIEMLKDRRERDLHEQTSGDVAYREEQTTQRNDDDNETALQIAEMNSMTKATGKLPQRGLPATNYPVSAPTQNKPMNPRG